MNQRLIPWAIATVGLVLALSLGSWGQSHPQRGQFLSVEITNDAGALVKRVEIQHRESHLQGTITLTDIQPGERRLLSLNLRPGTGFSVSIFQDLVKKRTVILGKGAKQWRQRIRLTQQGARFLDGDGQR